MENEEEVLAEQVVSESIKIYQNIFKRSVQLALGTRGFLRRQVSDVGRYKVWILSVYNAESPKSRLPLDYAEALISSIEPERYKVYPSYSLTDKDEPEIHDSLIKYAISYGIVFVTRIRCRKATIMRKINGIFASAPIKVGGSLFSCTITYEKMSPEFLGLDNYAALLSSEEGKEYIGKDILKLENEKDRYPWQNKVLNFFYDESKEKFREADDRSIYWIQDVYGSTGKSKFVKWICVNMPNECVKVIFGSSSQLRSSLISCGPRLCYLIDVPRPKNLEDSMVSLLTVLEDLKNGYLVSNMYGQYSKLIMDPPHIIVLTNLNCPLEHLSLDRWQVYSINKETLDLEDLNDKLSDKKTRLLDKIKDLGRWDRTFKSGDQTS